MKILVIYGITWSPQRQSVNAFLQKPMARKMWTALYWNHYQNATTVLLSGRRHQIPSIMVDKISFKSLQRYFPNLTPYRFKIAKQHILIYGRGSPLPKSSAEENVRSS